MAKGQKRSNREQKKPKTSTKLKKTSAAPLTVQPVQSKFASIRKGK